MLAQGARSLGTLGPHLVRLLAAQTGPQAQALRGIATFVITRSPRADVSDLLWAAADGAPRARRPPAAASSDPHRDAIAAAAAATASPHAHGAAAPSVREAVARCAARLSVPLAPGTPTTYEGALGPSLQARVVIEAEAPFRVIHTNDAFEALSGFSASDVCGAFFSSLLSEADPSAVAQIEEAAEARARTQVQCVHHRSDGSTAPATLQLSPLYDATGHTSHLLGVVIPSAPAPAAAAAHGGWAQHGAGAGGGAAAYSASDDEAHGALAAGL